MAHELDGDWNIFIIHDESGDPEVTPDGTFHLVHNAANNQLENTSVHKDALGVSHKLTGSSKPTGSGKYDIDFSAEQIGTNPRPYLGRVLENKPPTDPKRKVIGGLTFEPLDIANDRSKKSTALDPGQVDGVWVGTNP